MPYSNNPHLPRVRAEAVLMVQSGKSVRAVARRFGFAHNTVRNWVKRGLAYGEGGRLVVPTLSSRPHHHPGTLAPEIVTRILELRQERQQCAETKLISSPKASQNANRPGTVAGPGRVELCALRGATIATTVLHAGQR